jgi:CheY-like chemotaxis protein
LIENIQEEEEGHEDQDKDRDDARPLHVLIVEDNIINQTVLKRQILKAGLTCDTANHGQDALNLIHQAHHRYMLGERDRAGYDVILMDLEMPVMDGLSALAKIREAEAEGQLKEQLVIALTGNARKGQIDQAIKAGMNDGEYRA